MIVKNISNTSVNINEKIIYPGQVKEVSNINDIKILLDMGYIEIVEDEKINKERLLEAFFNFHLNKSSREDLELVKKFYLNIYPIPNSVKNNIMDAENDEELIEILLNSFYPIIINNIN